MIMPETGHLQGIRYAAAGLFSERLNGRCRIVVGYHDCILGDQAVLDLCDQRLLLLRAEFVPLGMVQVILHLLADSFELIGGDTHRAGAQAERPKILAQFGSR